MKRALLAVLAGLTVAAFTAVAAGPVPQISAQALQQRLQSADADLLVIDVRTPEEYAAGHLPGAINLPHEQVATRLAELPKDKDLVLYCRSGRRVGIAAGVLEQNGYTRLAHLTGDIVGWQDAGRPIEKSVPGDKP